MACFPDSAFPHTITQASLSTRSGYGDKAYGAQTTFAGQHMKERRRFVGEDGNEVAVNDVVTTLTAVVLPALIWLPGDDVLDPAKGRRIRGVNSFPEVEGSFTMYEILL